MKIGSPVTTVLDMVRIAMTPGVRISSTPFGPLGSRTFYVGRSVPWKMVHGIDQVRARNPAVAAGLEKAIRVSQAHHEKGVSVVRVDGGLKLMPTKAAMMMGAKGDVVASYTTSLQALQAMIPGAIAPAIMVPPA
jgi:hypothetical protein